MTEKTFDAGEIFSGKISGTEVLGFDAPAPQTPVSNPDFILSDWHGDVIAWACHMPSLPIYIYGPTGCGKSSILREIAARLNWPVYEVTGHEQLQAVDLAGHMALHDSATVWQDGPLAQALRNGGLFLFNEMDAALPGATVALNTILDGAPLCIEATGEVIRPHPMFRFAATGNTSGNGDEQGSYTGTSRQNIALLDRFYTCRGGYPSPEVEAILLKRAAPSLPEQALQYMHSVAAATRAVQGPDAAGLITTPISTRTLVLWARLAERFAPLRGKMVYNPLTQKREKCNVLGKALDHAIGFKRSESERNALHEILQRITGEEENHG